MLSRYTDVKNIIKYIQTQEIEEDITKGNVNNIASNYVALNFSKKLGRKKLVAIKKKSIDILHSQAVKHYSQYLTSSKQINHKTIITIVCLKNSSKKYKRFQLLPNLIQQISISLQPFHL